MVVNLTNGNCGYFERTQSVTQYLSEIRKFDILTKEQETALFKIVINGTVKDGNKYIYTPEAEAARKQIANANQRLVLSVARHYASNDKILDCVSVGTEGMMEAIDKYRLDLNTKFSTYAITYIRRNITQYLRDEDPSVRQTNTSKTYHCIAKARNEFIQKEERDPSPEELMDILNDEYGCNIKDPNDIIDMRVISMDESVSDDDESSVGDSQLFNTHTCNDNMYVRKSENDYAKELATSLFSILSPREIQIISMTFGMNGYNREYEAKEIAEVLKITPERVRQLKTSIIERLKAEALSRMKQV